MNAIATSYMDQFAKNLTNAYERNKTMLFTILAVMAVALFSQMAHAGTAGDTWAASALTFVTNAATGNFARAICICGGLIFLLMAAGSGKPISALGGVVLAAFGFLSPTLINAIFGTALI